MFTCGIAEPYHRTHLGPRSRSVLACPPSRIHELMKFVSSLFVNWLIGLVSSLQVNRVIKLAPPLFISWVIKLVPLLFINWVIKLVPPLFLNWVIKLIRPVSVHDQTCPPPLTGQLSDQTCPFHSDLHQWTYCYQPPHHLIFLNLSYKMMLF